MTDLRMPGTDGLELVRLMREQGDQVPVVVITGAVMPRFPKRPDKPALTASSTNRSATNGY
ncbi:response regulator [Devosia sp.]|uniref:response regulator n=1 Tax=Devosia sp. TaxID=1871048 RepID=UPI00345C32BA